MTNSSVPVKHVYPVQESLEIEEAEKFHNGWSSGIPLILDIGSSNSRVGYGGADMPAITFPTLFSRYRDRKATRSYTLCGNDIHLDSHARQNARSPFDGSLLSSSEGLEIIFDYSFSRLGVSSTGGVESPVLITELPGAPQSQRMALRELLFETYCVPSVSSGVDAMFSHYYNQTSPHGNSLVFSFGVNATHVIPVVGNRGLFSYSRRLNYGGSPASKYLQSLLALKYPLFPAKLTAQQYTNVYEDHCYVSKDYSTEVENFLSFQGLEDRERVISVPFTETAAPEKSEAELQKIAERRRESGRRLQQQAAKARLAKLMQKEIDLEKFKAAAEQVSQANKKDAKKILDSFGVRDQTQLTKIIGDMEKSIKRARKEDVGEEEEADPQFPLLELPDEELDEERLKEKRRQKLMKANYDARMRAREEKEQMRKRKEEAEKVDAEWRDRDLDGWVQSKKDELRALLEIKRERKKLKEDLGNRKSAASQMRMKSLAALASDSGRSKRTRRSNKDEVNLVSLKSGNGEIDGSEPTGLGVHVAVNEETFGADDDDWMVYRDIANATDSEEENEQSKRVDALREQLKKFDPDFSDELDAEKLNWSTSKLHLFLRGPRDYDPEDASQRHQMNLNIERIRAPEVYFQPSLAGLDQAGIIEIAEDILLRRLPDHKLYESIFLTGGCAKLANLEERIFLDLRSVLPVGSNLKVVRAKDPLLDCWKGMSKWSQSQEFAASSISRQEYLEKGFDYLKDNPFTFIPY